MLIIVAQGTRGDVQPLALLARQLQHGCGHALQATIITHAAHAVRRTCATRLAGQRALAL